MVSVYIQDKIASITDPNELEEMRQLIDKRKHELNQPITPKIKSKLERFLCTMMSESSAHILEKHVLVIVDKCNKKQLSLDAAVDEVKGMVNVADPTIDNAHVRLVAYLQTEGLLPSYANSRKG